MFEKLHNVARYERTLIRISAGKSSNFENGHKNTGCPKILLFVSYYTQLAKRSVHKLSTNLNRFRTF